MSHPAFETWSSHATANPIDVSSGPQLSDVAVDLDSGYQMDPIDSPFASFSFPERGVLNSEQIDFCIAKLRCLDSFVLEGRMPFLHPSSYRDSIPCAYQDVLGICSLYIHRNIQNRGIVFRMLDCKLGSLIRAARSVFHIEHNLLAVQALLIYQIIRIFDGDIMQRANAERDFQLLDDWTLRLQQGYFEAEQTIYPMAMHQNWILLESIRRTIMVSILLRGLCSIMKTGTCELVPLMSILPVSNTGKLWGTSDLDRSTEANVLGSSLVTYADFVEQWNNGQIEEVEDYEAILLKACRHARGTFHFKS